MTQGPVPVGDYMSERMDRPFSRFYAELRRVEGEEPDEDTEEAFSWIGAPELANPRRSSDGQV